MRIAPAIYPHNPSNAPQPHLHQFKAEGNYGNTLLTLTDRDNDETLVIDVTGTEGNVEIRHNPERARPLRVPGEPHPVWSRDDLTAIARDLQAGDWHEPDEPDERGISATISGNHLDNACGTHGREYVITLHRRDADTGKPDGDWAVNVADLLNWATSPAPALSELWQLAADWRTAADADTAHEIASRLVQTLEARFGAIPAPGAR